MVIQLQERPSERGLPVVVIRAMQPGDTERLEWFYAELSIESRYLRFMGGTRGISHGQSVSFCTPDHAHREGFVAVVRDEAAEADGIVGHLCLEPMGHTTAEVAIAVADAFQHHGVGRRLLAAGIDWARSVGITRLTATMFAGNTAIRRLLSSGGWSWTTRWLGSDTVEMTIDTAPPASAAA